MLIGILGIIALIIKNKKAKRNDPNIFFKKSLLKNYNARTVPPFGIWILKSEKNNEELLKHEWIHWKYYQQNGLLNYYFNYMFQKAKYGYDNMPMEVEARNESDYCKYNYTKCVRTGQSNTIYNPEFRS